jgi:voltage-gated potassium channel
VNVALRRIRRGALVLAVILAASVYGYRLLGRSWLDALYMVVITVATVGFGEHSELPPAEQLLTIAVILFGISAWVYVVGGFFQWMTEGELEKVLGARRMTSEIQHLQQHVIVCGFGRMGQMLAHDLRHDKQCFVVIENDPQRVVLAQSLEYLVYNGDATEEDVLTSVGIERAKTLVVALPNDAASVFIALTARNLNRSLQIIARGEQPSTQKKLVQAGADRVVMPATIGAQRIAAMITRPSTVDLLELVAGPKTLDVEINEWVIPAASVIVGRTVDQVEARRRHQLLVVAVRRASGNLLFNPDGDFAFAAQDTIIVMGRRDDLDRFRRDQGM